MSEFSSNNARFISLLTKHQAALFVFVRSFVSDINDAEDILQETNLALWEHSGRFDHSRGFYAYATKVAFHKVSDHARRKKKLGGLVFNTDILDLISSKLSEEPEDGSLAVKTQALESCIGKLPSGDRDLLNKRYQNGSSIRSLVAESGKTETTLQYHFARIRGVLKNCIEKTLDLPERT